jgi:hypothetical protein
MHTRNIYQRHGTLVLSGSRVCLLGHTVSKMNSTSCTIMAKILILVTDTKLLACTCHLCLSWNISRASTGPVLPAKAWTWISAKKKHRLSFYSAENTAWYQQTSFPKISKDILGGKNDGPRHVIQAENRKICSFHCLSNKLRCLRSWELTLVILYNVNSEILTCGSTRPATCYGSSSL